MMGRFQVICTMDQIKEAKRNVQRYMRKHKSDEDFIENISDDFVMGFMISQRMAWDDCDSRTLRENDYWGKWVPCSDELPKESDYYMACIYDEDVEEYDFRKTWFAHKDDYDMDESEWREIQLYERVVAWMPLPEPYKEDDD